MKASLGDESGWRRAVVTGGEGPSGDFRQPDIRVAPHPWVPAFAGKTVWSGFRIRSGKTVREWVPACAGTTVWRGFRISAGDGGMGSLIGYFEKKGLLSLGSSLVFSPAGQGIRIVRATLPAARSSNASLTSSRGLCRVTNSSSFSLPLR